MTVTLVSVTGDSDTREADRSVPRTDTARPTAATNESITPILAPTDHPISTPDSDVAVLPPVSPEDLQTRSPRHSPPVPVTCLPQLYSPSSGEYLPAHLAPLPPAPGSGETVREVQGEAGGPHTSRGSEGQDPQLRGILR